jgi:hypothetical protein
MGLRGQFVIVMPFGSLELLADAGLLLDRDDLLAEAALSMIWPVGSFR